MMMMTVTTCGHISRTYLSVSLAARMCLCGPHLLRNESFLWTCQCQYLCCHLHTPLSLSALRINFTVCVCVCVRAWLCMCVHRQFIHVFLCQEDWLHRNPAISLWWSPDQPWSKAVHGGCERRGSQPWTDGPTVRITATECWCESVCVWTTVKDGTGWSLWNE